MSVRKFTSILLILVVFLIGLNVSVLADETDGEEVDSEKISDLEEKIEEYEEKVEKLQDRGNSLAKEIEYSDSQIHLTELRIANSEQKLAQKEEAILKLSDDIADLSVRIDKLADSIKYQEKVLRERLRTRYKTHETSPLIALLGGDIFSRVVQKSEYLRIMEIQDRKIITQMNDTKKAYGQQKDLFEDKKEEEEELKKQIEVEKANLVTYQAQLQDQKAEKQQLLSVTQNDEAKYQKLLEEARKELQSYKNFTQSAGGGVIGSNEFGKGNEGWYYSQRDERWAGNKIGSSSETIFDVGCLVTSVAMVFKSQGDDVDPADIAKRSSYYLPGTAYMIVPGDFSSYWGGHSALKSRIEDSLDDDVPVIVGVYAGPYGTHFVVLSEEDDGDYTMYDPWYGPDLKFSDHYSNGSIYEAIILK